MGDINELEKIKKIIIGITIALVIVVLTLTTYFVYDKVLNQDKKDQEYENNVDQNTLIDNEKINEYLHPVLRAYSSISVEGAENENVFRHIVLMMVINNSHTKSNNTYFFPLDIIKEYAKKYYDINNYKGQVTLADYKFEASKAGYTSQLAFDEIINQANSYEYILENTAKFGREIIVVYTRRGSDIKEETYEVSLLWKNESYVINSIRKN